MSLWPQKPRPARRESQHALGADHLGVALFYSCSQARQNMQNWRTHGQESLRLSVCSCCGHHRRFFFRCLVYMSLQKKKKKMYLHCCGNLVGLTTYIGVSKERRHVKPKASQARRFSFYWSTGGRGSRKDRQILFKPRLVASKICKDFFFFFPGFSSTAHSLRSHPQHLLTTAELP